MVLFLFCSVPEKKNKVILQPYKKMFVANIKFLLRNKYTAVLYTNHLSKNLQTCSTSEFIRPEQDDVVL